MKDTTTASRRPALPWIVVLAMLSLAGCAVGDNPENKPETLYSPQQVTYGREYEGQVGGTPGYDPTPGVCPSADAMDYIAPPAPGRTSAPDTHMRYSAGDRFHILVPGMPDFSGEYTINGDGRVVLPFAGEIRAVGLTNAELNTAVEQAFIQAGILKEAGARVAVRPLQFAPINILVSGAVFAPGRVAINNTVATRGANPQFGDAPQDRYVPAGLKAAGGVRPDADVSSIFLVRGGKRYRLNWRGAFTGERVDDVALIDGDKLEVAESPCFQTGLIRPTQITPPGIRIFQSNLTVPATNNASSSIGQYSGSLPYGTRFLQALAGANCIGGTLSTNAARQAVLISRNPKTMQTEVIQRSIEELVRSANRDAVNPHLMPDDAIACYDSSVTEFDSVMAILNTTSNMMNLNLNSATYARTLMFPRY